VNQQKKMSSPKSKKKKKVRIKKRLNESRENLVNLENVNEEVRDEVDEINEETKHTSQRREQVMRVFQPGWSGRISMRGSPALPRRTTRKELKKNKRILLSMIVLVATFAIVEFVFGVISNSLALLSDAFHMISDLISLIVGFVAVGLAARPSSQTKTYGWKRAEVIGGLVNGIFLLSVVFFILLQSIERFIEPPVIKEPVTLVIVGCLGLVVNLVGLALFASHATLQGAHGHSHSHGKNDKHEEESKGNLNLHGVFLHVLGDALGSIGAIATGVIVWVIDDQYTWKYYSDPIFSVVLALIILRTSVPLVSTTVSILMQSVPESVDVDEITKEILKIDGVDYIGALHVWTLAPGSIVASLHIDCNIDFNFDVIVSKLRRLFHKNGIAQITVQPHFVTNSLKSKVHDQKYLVAGPSNSCCDRVPIQQI